jgi:butyryl-CoA dehydrogenase
VLAVQRLDEPMSDFAQGKPAAARYFFAYELPKIGAWLDVVARRESLCRDLRAEWF